jgi:hypothetical protein
MDILQNRYAKTINTIETNLNTIIEEIIFFQHTQTAILRNDSYLIKDKDTQAIFENVLCKNQQKMTTNNHQRGFDLKHLGNQISIKSGTMLNSNLQISYSRTTEFPKLEDKIAYLSTFENLILGIASEKIKMTNSQLVTQTRYHLYYFPADTIKMNNMEWSEVQSKYVGIDKETNILVEIKKKMSDQPWITIPTSNLITLPLVETSISIHKNRKYLIIDNLLNEDRTYYDIYEQRKKLKAVKGIQKCSLSTIKAPIS